MGCYNIMRKGCLEIITGCMYSGKTEELIRRIRRHKIAGRKVQIFNSHRDTRYSLNAIESHLHHRLGAIQVKDSKTTELLKLLDYSSDVIAIDEIQFFEEEIINVCNNLADEGKIVIAAGLDLDFRGEPFRGPMPKLLAIADNVDKLTGICVYCGESATRTQRMVRGRPAKWSETIYLRGNQNTYLAVCRNHHQIDPPQLKDEKNEYQVIDSLPE